MCEISEVLGLSKALASHHLKRLRAAELVATERRGQWLYCRLDCEALREVADGLREIAEAPATDRAACCGRPPARNARAITGAGEGV